MRRYVMPLMTVALASPVLAPLPAVAATNPSAHPHGHAELQVAIDTNTADVFLRSPAYNLLGFEHEPRTEQQHRQLADLEQWLMSTPLINTEDGNCNVEDASVHSSWPEATRHHSDHAHEHHDHDHEDGQANDHSDIEITQSLTCDGLADHQTLTTPMAKHFPALEHLDVQWIGPEGQGATRLEAGDQQFRVGR